MIKFTESTAAMKKKFVGLFFTEQTQKQLCEWAQSENFDLSCSFSGEKQDPSEFDFHTTVYFTESEHVTPVGDTHIEAFKLKPIKYELLGKSNNIPVLKIDTDNDRLMQIRHFYTAQGFKDSWPSFKPHISLSYNWNGRPDISSLKLPSIEIWVNRIQVSNQE